MLKSSVRCFCAFCRTKRTVYRKKHISIMDAFWAAASSLLLSFIIWQTFDPRAVVFFAFGLGFAEVFILIRWRVSIACPHCGFDPVLYKRNKEAAATRVKAHLEQRRLDPLSAFTPLPKLPVIVKKAGAPVRSAVSRTASRTESRVPARTTPPRKEQKSTRSLRA